MGGDRKSSVRGQTDAKDPEQTMSCDEQPFWPTPREHVSLLATVDEVIE
jgi:hypothetical protein